MGPNQKNVILADYFDRDISDFQEFNKTLYMVKISRSFLSDLQFTCGLCKTILLKSCLKINHVMLQYCLTKQHPRFRFENKNNIMGIYLLAETGKITSIHF